MIGRGPSPSLARRALFSSSRRLTRASRLATCSALRARKARWTSRDRCDRRRRVNFGRVARARGERRTLGGRVLSCLRPRFAGLGLSSVGVSGEVTSSCSCSCIEALGGEEGSLWAEGAAVKEENASSLSGLDTARSFRRATFFNSNGFKRSTFRIPADPRRSLHQQSSPRRREKRANNQPVLPTERTDRPGEDGDVLYFALQNSATRSINS